MVGKRSYYYKVASDNTCSVRCRSVDHSAQSELQMEHQEQSFYHGYQVTGACTHGGSTTGVIFHPIFGKFCGHSDAFKGNALPNAPHLRMCTLSDGAFTYSYLIDDRLWGDIETDAKAGLEFHYMMHVKTNLATVDKIRMIKSFMNANVCYSFLVCKVSIISYLFHEHYLEY